jgi:multiple sugar transport system ATP-binding protein
MAGVTLDHLTKKYGEVTAVNDLNIQIRDQEFLVLVGPSGCGKSTALRMIAGLEEITGGDLYIGDRRVNDVAPKDRDIAMVFQSYALYPHMSVYDNMAFGLKLRHLSKNEIDERVRRAASMLGLEQVLDRKPKQLSGGQRQRVALGRALVREPAAFLLDEPLSNLDAKLRLQTRAEIAKLHQRLTAPMIYVTHDQIEAMTLGERIVVLDAGKIQQIDAPLKLYREPANRFVAGFIGSPPMNFLEGRIEDGRFISEGLTMTLPRVPRQGPIVLGIRPEHVGVGPGPTFTLDLVEPIGNEMFIYASMGATHVVARVAPQELPKVGSPIELSFDETHLHFFDGATGLRL